MAASEAGLLRFLEARDEKKQGCQFPPLVSKLWKVTPLKTSCCWNQQDDRNRFCLNASADAALHSSCHLNFLFVCRLHG